MRPRWWRSTRCSRGCARPPSSRWGSRPATRRPRKSLPRAWQRTCASRCRPRSCARWTTTTRPCAASPGTSASCAFRSPRCAPPGRRSRSRQIRSTSGSKKTAAMGCSSCSGRSATCARPPSTVRPATSARAAACACWWCAPPSATPSRPRARRCSNPSASPSRASGRLRESRSATRATWSPRRWSTTWCCATWCSPPCSAWCWCWRCCASPSARRGRCWPWQARWWWAAPGPLPLRASPSAS